MEVDQPYTRKISYWRSYITRFLKENQGEQEITLLFPYRDGDDNKMTTSINNEMAYDITVLGSLSRNLTLTVDQLPSKGVEVHPESAIWS